MRPSTAYEISQAFDHVERAVHHLNYVVSTGEADGIRKAELERAARKTNEVFSILARDQQIHEN